MGMFDRWRKKATQLAKEHPEEVEKYSDKIKMAEEKADDAVSE